MGSQSLLFYRRESLTFSIKVLTIVLIVLAASSDSYYNDPYFGVNASLASNQLPATSTNLINIVDHSNLSVDVNHHPASSPSQTTNPSNTHHSSAVQDVYSQNQHQLQQQQQQQQQQQHQHQDSSSHQSFLSTSALINSVGHNNQLALEQTGENVNLETFGELTNGSPSAQTEIIPDTMMSDLTVSTKSQPPNHQSIERRFGLFKKGNSGYHGNNFATSSHYGGSGYLMNDCDRCLASMSHQASTNADLQAEPIQTMQAPGMPFMQPFSPLKNKLFIKFPLLKPIPIGDSFSPDSTLWPTTNIHYQQHNRLPSLASSMFQPMRPSYNCIQSPPIVATTSPAGNQEPVSGKLKSFQTQPSYHHAPSNQY